MKLSRAVAVLMFLFVPLSLQAAQTQTIRVLGIPAGPGIVRHVEILGTTDAYIPQRNVWVTTTYAQNDRRITDSDALDLADAIRDWLDDTLPAPPTIWHRTKIVGQSVTFDTLFTTYGTTNARVTLQTTSFYLDDQFGTVETANAVAKQQVVLTPSDGASLADGLEAWVDGTLVGNLIFTKSAQQP